MLVPIEIIDFDSVTIGHFNWLVDDKLISVIRIVGTTKNGKNVDRLFKQDFNISNALDILLEDVNKRMRK